MSNEKSLLSISHDAPVDGHGEVALPTRVELSSAQLLLELAQIPVVTQNSQEGKSFYVPLRSLPCFDQLTLWKLHYFIYSLHADASALTPINEFGQIPPPPAPIGQNEPTTTMAPLPTAVVTPHSVEIASDSELPPIDLTSIVSPSSAAQQMPVVW
jgi:hypothetical protein